MPAQVQPYLPQVHTPADSQGLPEEGLTAPRVWVPAGVGTGGDHLCPLGDPPKQACSLPREYPWGAGCGETNRLLQEAPQAVGPVPEASVLENCAVLSDPRLEAPTEVRWGRAGRP